MLVADEDARAILTVDHEARAQLATAPIGKTAHLSNDDLDALEAFLMTL